MEQVDVIELLKKLSRRELNDLGQFLATRLASTSYAMKLFNYLLKQYPEFPKSHLSYGYLSKHLIAGKVLKKIWLQNALSDLRIQVKSYCISLELERNTFLKDVLLLKFYKRNHHDKLFEKHFKKLEVEYRSSARQDLWSAVRKQEIYHEYYFLNRTNFSKSRESLKFCITALDDFYTSAKLRYAAELHNRYNLINDEFIEVRHLEEIANLNFDVESYYQKMYQLILVLVRTKTIEAYNEAKILFLESVDKFVQEDQFVFFSYLINFSSSEIKSGNVKFLEEAHRLYRVAFDKGFTSIDGKVNLSHFLNAIDIASDLSYFRWANNLIDSYTDDFSLDVREYAVSLANGMLFFKRRRFEDCMVALRFIELNEPSFSIRGRWLRIRCFYELGYSTDFIKQFTTRLARAVKRNKKLPSHSKEAVLNSLRLIILLAKRKDKGFLKEYMNEHPQLITSTWFKDKLKEL